MPMTSSHWVAGWLAGWLGPVFEVLCLYLALGHRSLHQHARPVADALVAGDEAAARTLASRLVSRDAHTMHVARATTESVLENGCDAVLASLFWYLAAGAPGVVAHRLCNTLDAMWGYRNQRYRDFGWAAARSDDVLNWCPARLCALGYALLGRTGAALDCVRRQAARWESPNAGVVMAAGAGALQVTLGGPARYRGEVRERVRLGAGAEPGPEDILRALSLLRASVALWLVVSGLAAFAPLVPQVPAG